MAKDRFNNQKPNYFTPNYTPVENRLSTMSVNQSSYLAGILRNNRSQINDWEYGFIQNVVTRNNKLSTKQKVVIKKIVSKF